jgi:predicted DNA-binding protein (UPF0251 family)
MKYVPRPPKNRFVEEHPPYERWGPKGIPHSRLEQVQLKVDEYEAIRLADLEGLSQEEASEKMGVSRATFGRILESARKKVAESIVNGKGLNIEGGVYVMVDQRTFECWDCKHRFAVPQGVPRPDKCPSCGSANFHRVEEERGGPGGGAAGRGAGHGRGRGGNR